MKWLDWLIVSLLMIIGLSCLTMSATWMINPGSIQSFLNNFFQICLWFALPILVLAILYVLVKRKKRDS